MSEPETEPVLLHAGRNDYRLVVLSEGARRHVVPNHPDIDPTIRGGVFDRAGFDRSGLPLFRRTGPPQ